MNGPTRRIGEVFISTIPARERAVGLTDRVTGRIDVLPNAPPCVLVHEGVHLAFAQLSTPELPGEEQAVRAAIRAIYREGSNHPLLRRLFNGPSCP